MKKIFLGPFIHWMTILVVIGAGWFAGLNRFHASTFNTFMVLLLVLVVAILVSVIMTSPTGRRVTRDPIIDKEDDPN